MTTVYDDSASGSDDDNFVSDDHLVGLQVRVDGLALALGEDNDNIAQMNGQDVNGQRISIEPMPGRRQADREGHEDVAGAADAITNVVEVEGLSLDLSEAEISVSAHQFQRQIPLLTHK
ncbi:hypothetical protein LTR36_003727 [Oleoguttula mirabilis]|uniref:Uncharacterized protein n=1 Tax=Oleoguttula mirabilis TaxID=1507867 RepID=A0AAV9JIV5_9PEZI|nr:hypothetical protein LTR36_003727 [Oleoguttula mirabilis]